MMFQKFGKKPTGERLARLQKSPNYQSGKFVNFNLTPQITEGYTMLGVMYEFFFKKAERRFPIDIIPSVKTDLLNLLSGDDVLVWFGHSSYFMQVNGKRMLVDPVFSGNASPIPGSIKAFEGTDRYTVDDMPNIDYLFISHDHYDHLDYETIVKLKPKIKKVICGLGVGAHFEYWGYAASDIIEKDWNEKIELGDGFIVNTTPARHFSGRGLSRCNTLWQSYVLQTPTMKIFIGGDSGYDTHFATIGKEHGPFDLAILENGQYDKKWRYIHSLPDEVLKAAEELKAKRLFPVHSSKFALANHAWDEPLSKITALNQEAVLSIITPMIGERVNLKDVDQQFTNWWENVK